MPWPISNHESPDVDLSIPVVTAPHYLWAILQADGTSFRDGDYRTTRDALREAKQRFSTRSTGGQAPNPEVSEQRLRTWKTAFEEMGLLTVDAEGVVRATRFGRAVVEGLDTVASALDGANHRIAQLGIAVANRVLLAKPDRSGNPPEGVPSGVDLHPLRAIWKAFRRLDNKMHWQDINRVLGHIHNESEVEPAIAKIAAFRSSYPDGYSDAVALQQLGGATLTEDPRHITPWFNRAGLGGIFLPSEADAGGFREITDEAAALFDSFLAEPTPTVPRAAFSDRAAYIDYLMEPVEASETPSLAGDDAKLVEQIVAAARSHGRKKIIALSGIPGTGKTRLARIVADILTEGDPTRSIEIQFHESTSYEDFIEGFVPRVDGQGFQLRPKTLLRINQRALDDPLHTYVLIIEEFTRANAHAVLGELLTYIEHRGRQFTLSLSQAETCIAENLVVLVTMNPKDRSAVSLDDAVMRRLHRVTIPSSADALRAMLDGKLPDDDMILLSEWFDRYLDDLPFGHGVFSEAISAVTLSEIWKGTVVPLLCDGFGRLREVHSEAFTNFPFQGAEAEL